MTYYLFQKELRSKLYKKRHKITQNLLKAKILATNDSKAAQYVVVK